MKIKKKYMVIFIAILLMSAVSVKIYEIIEKNMTPIKYAIKELPPEDTPFILVKITRTTVSDWYAVGDNHGYYGEERYVLFLDDKFPIFSGDIEFADNTFVCYGEYIEKNVDGEILYVFDLQGWDIMAPIKRARFEHFLLHFNKSADYMTEFDF